MARRVDAAAADALSASRSGRAGRARIWRNRMGHGGRMTHPFLQSILDTPLDATTKGIPLAGETVRLGDVGTRGWNAVRGDMVLPLLVLRETHLAGNLRAIRDFAAHHGVWLAPHGKSSLCPQLYLRHVAEAGIWGMSAATTQQAAVIAATGLSNILLVNQVVGRAALAQLVALQRAHPDCAIHSLVDSQEGLTQLLAHGASLLRDGERLRVLIEIGVPGGRGGVRDAAAAAALADRIAAHPDRLALTGIECYEGAAGGGTQDEMIAAIDALLDRSVDMVIDTHRRGLFADRSEILLTAAGSTHFDRAVARLQRARSVPGLRIVLRGGSSLISDHGVYRAQLALMDGRGGMAGASGARAASASFKPALELLAGILSVQDRGMAIVNMGIRDMPFDQGFPVPLRQYRDGVWLRDIDATAEGWRIARSHDQHCFLSFPAAADLVVGDMIAFGISHPCTAFDKWRVFYGVDDDFTVTGAFRTFF
jgi:D-serine dehydratase